MDLIIVKGVKASGRHGVAPFERENPTELEVDVELSYDLAPASTSDSLGMTIDYTTVISEIRRVVETSSHAIIETVAQAISEAMLQLGADSVLVRVSKPTVAASLGVEEVAVEIERGDV